MPMDFLRHIASQRLPMAVYAPADIDRLRVLRAAELVTATIPPAESMEGGASSHRTAQVLTITAKGRQALLDEQQSA